MLVAPGQDLRQSQAYLVGAEDSGADLSPQCHGSYMHTFCNSGNLKAQNTDGNLC